MSPALFALASWLNPKTLIEKGGLLVLSLIIFAESGLLIGFFLPGDSLLFIAGFLTSNAARDVPGFQDLFAGGNPLPPLPIVLVCVFVAAVVGDQVGYLIGKKAGPTLFHRPDSRLFKQQNVVKAHDFFEKYGSKTIVLARFVPIVRTFAPVVAGVGEMRYRTFVSFNVIGALLWSVGVTLLGHYLGNVAFVREHIELALIGIVFVSVIPIAIELWRSRRHAAEEPVEVELAAEEPLA